MEYIKGNSGLHERDCYLECESLETGTYQLFCEVDWLSSSPDNDFVVTCYGIDSANFVSETKKYKKQDVIKNLMRGMVDFTLTNDGQYNIEEDVNKENKNIKTYTLTSDFNYLITLIQNDDDSSTYQISMNFPKFEGMELLSPEKGESY
jgi:hypothetical protein